MPEGDVVFYTARRLHEALAGRTLTRSDFRVPRLATADLTGDVGTETVPRGKHLLGPDWDCAEAVRRLSVEPSRPIGEALLDQRNLAGVGTWFAAEMLFLRGI